jgi:hypothetical protein
VKYYILTMAVSVAMAQSVSKTYMTDLNGHSVETGTVVTSDHETSEITQNLNGRRVPMQQTDEKILKQDGNSKLVEKIIRKYDRNGQLASTDRLLIDEQSRPSGSTTRTTLYRTDVNGRMQEVERETTQVEKQGSSQTSETVIERPTLNSSLQPVEKRIALSATTGETTHADETVYQRSENGGYVVTAREVKDTTRTGTQTTEKSALYQPVGNSAQPQLTVETVSKTTTRPDGSEITEVNRYGNSWDGRAHDNETGPSLQQQEIITREKVAGGIAETRSVRRPTPSDPNKLGPLMKVSETQCSGKCQ